MKRAIQIGSGIRDHVNPANVKGSARGIKLTRIFTAEKVAYQRGRKPFISNQPIVNRVAQIDVLRQLRRKTTHFLSQLLEFPTSVCAASLVSINLTSQRAKLDRNAMFSALR